MNVLTWRIQMAPINEKSQIKLTLVSGCIKYYKKLLLDGKIKPDGGAMRRLNELKQQYKMGRRQMRNTLRVEESINSDATPVTKPAAAARPSKFLMI